TQPASAVAPHSQTTFTIKFAPTTTDLHAAIVTILSDDPDENPYTFDITGSGLPRVLGDLSINSIQGAEGNSGTANAIFTVTLSAVSSQTATVSFATADGTAT